MTMTSNLMMPCSTRHSSKMYSSVRTKDLMVAFLLLSLTLDLTESQSKKPGSTGRSVDSDSELQQTVLLNKLSSRQRKHLKQEILGLLGLDHTPRPVAAGTKGKSAPRFMMSLYKKLQQDGDDASPGKSDGVVDGQSTTFGISWQLDSADMVMSFLNHGLCYCLLFGVMNRGYCLLFGVMNRGLCYCLLFGVMNRGLCYCLLFGVINPVHPCTHKLLYP